jgi:hypothetical protein
MVNIRQIRQTFAFKHKSCTRSQKGLEGLKGLTGFQTPSTLLISRKPLPEANSETFETFETFSTPYVRKKVYAICSIQKKHYTYGGRGLKGLKGLTHPEILKMRIPLAAAGAWDASLGSPEV